MVHLLSFAGAVTIPGAVVWALVVMSATGNPLAAFAGLFQGLFAGLVLLAAGEIIRLLRPQKEIPVKTLIQEAAERDQ